MGEHYWIQKAHWFKLKYTLLIFLAFVLFIFFYLAVESSWLKKSAPASFATTSNSKEETEQRPDRDALSSTSDQESGRADGSFVREIYSTRPGGRTWNSLSWTNGVLRTLQSGTSDPYDLEFVMRGDGQISINGNGIIDLSGSAPRMYVYDPLKQKKWRNVEVTVYAKRISEVSKRSSQGIVIGARSEHQDATEENPCLGATYYGRLLYDGRAVFQKELIHEDLYSVNKPSENNKVRWESIDGTMPKNIWIGVKFIVKTNPDEKTVKLELYRDMTDDSNGGKWEKVAEYTDKGDWSQNNSKVNIKKKCGYSGKKVLIDPATSVFVRNDEISEMQYKLFSIREID